MADSDKQGRTTTAGEILDRGKTTRSAKTGGLAGLSGKLGNDELMGRIEQGNANRDELLEFLVNRLESMRTSQLTEIAMTRATDNETQTNMADLAQKGIRLDPTRWIEPARLYEQAARALCSGQLHRGSELVGQAMKADHRAYDQLSGLVQVDEAMRAGQPGALADISADTACADCPEPAGVEVAYEIQRVTNDHFEGAFTSRRELDPWWTDLEEEEEEEEGANG